MPRQKPQQYRELEAELKAELGAQWVLSAAEDLAVFECDGETLDTAIPDLVVLPSTTQEVQSVVRLAARYNVPVTARGAGTGLSGGATPVMGGLSLVLTRMTAILEIDPDNLCAHVEAGVTNAAVSCAAEKYNLYFAPDPSSSIASTIGGNIAENAGGAHTLKYGMTVNNTLGLQVVLPDGNVTVFGGKARDCLGLDLLGLFVGSEGTLGIATQAYLRLTPRPQDALTMLAYFCCLEDGGQCVSDIIAQGIIPAAMEMIDAMTLNCVEDCHKLGLKRDAGALLVVELDGPKSAIALEKAAVEQCAFNNKCLDIHWAADAQERMLIWKARKSAFGALGRLAPHGYVLDGVIPRSKLREAIAEIHSIGLKHDLPIANVYHAGDGNLHPCLLYNRDNEAEVRRVLLAGREILELCVNLGGTLSGEHGIGVEKLLEMKAAFCPSDLASMLSVREAFDPRLLFNPGKLIPTTKSCGESGARPLLRHQIGSC